MNLDSLPFHLKIKFLREKNGYTQQELADKLGITKGSVSIWEQGKAKPTFYKLQQLEELFKYSFTEKHIVNDPENDYKNDSNIIDRLEQIRKENRLIMSTYMDMVIENNEFKTFLKELKKMVVEYDCNTKIKNYVLSFPIQKV